MTTPYTAFVKENYPTIKAGNPEANSKDILRLIATEWNKTKPPKEAKPTLKRTPKAKPAPKQTKLIEISGNIKDQIDNILPDDSCTPPPVSIKADSKARKVTQKANGTVKKRKGEAIPHCATDTQEIVK